MSKRITKTAAMLAAVAVFSTFTACGSSPDTSQSEEQAATASAKTSDDIKVYDFPEDMQYEILRGVKYGMTMQEVIDIEGEPTESNNLNLNYSTDVNGYSADLWYTFRLCVTGDDTVYQNVNSAKYTFDIEGLTDAQKYNEYKQIRNLYIDKYGEPSKSSAFTGDYVDMSDFPTVDSDFLMPAITTFFDYFDIDNLSIRLSYSKTDDGESLDISYVCDNPLDIVNI